MNKNDSYECKWNSCNKVFNSSENLVEHFKKHLVELPEFCGWEDCKNIKYPIIDKDHCFNHLKAHIGEAPFQCHVPSCKKVYKRFDAFSKHIANYSHAEESVKNEKFEAPSSKKSTSEKSPDNPINNKRNFAVQLEDSVESESKRKKSKTTRLSKLPMDDSNETSSIANTKDNPSIQLLNSKEETVSSPKTNFKTSSEHLKNSERKLKFSSN
ncbi:hypothetical protein BB558_006389, partial [Smittium angustum]